MKVLISCLKNGFYFLFSIILLIAGFEIYCGISNPSNSYQHWRANTLSYLLDDNLGWKLKQRRYFWGQINQNHHRGPLVKQNKSSSSLRILVLGDGAAFDFFKYDWETWPILLSERLEHKLSKSVEVINASTPGYSTWHTQRLLPATLKKWNPDLVIIAHLYEDWILPEGQSDKYIEQGYKLEAISKHVSRLAQPIPIIDKLTTLNPRSTDVIRGVIVKYLESIRKNESYNYWCSGKKARKRNGEQAFGQYRKNLESIVSAVTKIETPVVMLSMPTGLKKKPKKVQRSEFNNFFCGEEPESVYKDFQSAHNILEKIANSNGFQDSAVILLNARDVVSPKSTYIRNGIQFSKAASQKLANFIANSLLTELPAVLGDTEQTVPQDTTVNTKEAIDAANDSDED